MFVVGSEFGTTEWADNGVGVEVCEAGKLVTGADAFSLAEGLFEALNLTTSPRAAARGRSKFIKRTEHRITHRHANMSPKDLMLRIARNANLLLIDICPFSQSEEIASIIGGSKRASGGPPVVLSRPGLVYPEAVNTCCVLLSYNEQNTRNPARLTLLRSV